MGAPRRSLRDERGGACGDLARGCRRPVTFATTEVAHFCNLSLRRRFPFPRRRPPGPATQGGAILFAAHTGVQVARRALGDGAIAGGDRAICSDGFRRSKVRNNL